MSFAVEKYFSPYAWFSVPVPVDANYFFFLQVLLTSILAIVHYVKIGESFILLNLLYSFIGNYRGHSFSKFAKFYKKHYFLTPNTLMYVCVSGSKN